MPKIVDHAKRREEIAHVACQVVASYGFEQATVARIARAAGYTTGMVAHYYDSKQDIILAALRLILLRIEERLTRERRQRRGESSGACCRRRSPSMPSDVAECTFWMAFWGQVSDGPANSSGSTFGCTASTCGCLPAVSPSIGRNGRRGRPGCANQVLRFDGHFHQRVDRGRGDESARLAGADADRAAEAAARICCAAGPSRGVDAQRAGLKGG